MAHYAFLDNNNVVTEVITGVDENIVQTDLDGTQVGGSTEAWEQFYGNIKGQVCKRTSYNTKANSNENGNLPFRGNYAGIGYTYDKDFDVFIPLRPYPSWKLNYTTFEWKAPVEKPADIEGYFWRWSEINLEWIKVSLTEILN